MQFSVSALLPTLMVPQETKWTIMPYRYNLNINKHIVVPAYSISKKSFYIKALIQMNSVTHERLNYCFL